MGMGSSTQEIGLEGRDAARPSGGQSGMCGGRPLLCCGKGGGQRPGGMWADYDEPEEEEQADHCDCWGKKGRDQEALLRQERQDACRRKLVIGASICLVLLAGAAVVVLALNVSRRKKLKAPDAAFVAASRQIASAVTRGECDYMYTGGSKAMCFCQLAGNAHCASDACACSQGCEETIVAQTSRSVTFENLARAGICEETKALLTIPKAYFEHISFLLQWCPSAARTLLIEMMEKGFNTYQSEVKEGPVKQCVHAAKAISIPWLHVHTFCADGLMDGMQDTSADGWCGQINEVAEIPSMVDQLVAWGSNGKEMLHTTNFASCRSMGCGQANPQPLCSCKTECRAARDVTCCEDQAESCEG